MNKKIGIFLVSICLASFLAGCATVPANGVLDAKGKTGKFTDMSDEEALQKVVAIYNVKTECGEDEAAKNIAMGVYMDELAKRKSKFLDDSGVFKLEFKREDLKKWDDQQIARMYDFLDSKFEVYQRAEVSGMDEETKNLMVARLTAMDAVYKEGKKRDLFRNMAEVAMNALMMAASIAVSII